MHNQVSRKAHSCLNTFLFEKAHDSLSGTAFSNRHKRANQHGVACFAGSGKISFSLAGQGLLFAFPNYSTVSQ
jgi:hypothetical protein